MTRGENKDEDEDQDHDQNEDDVDEQQETNDPDFKVYEGQTEDERREIRKSQRKLRHEISDIDVDKARDKNNQIFKKVRYIREAVLDSENFDEIAKKAAANVEQIIKVSNNY